VVMLLGLSLMPPAAFGQATSELDVAIHGTILTTAFRNSGRFNNADVPTVSALGPAETAFGATVRQTRLLVRALHPAVLGGRLVAKLEADFFGGQFASAGGRTHPVLRIRRAFAEIH